MLRGLTLSLTLLVLAAPAGAQTYNGRAEVGPAIAGDSVVWGQKYSDDSGAVKRDGRLVARFPAPIGKRDQRSFGGISGSLTRLAYTVIDTRDTGALNEESRAGALLSSGGGPFTDPLGCEAEYINPAVDGDNVALAVGGSPPCEGVYVNGRKIDAEGTRHVKLAGPYVAWLAA